MESNFELKRFQIYGLLFNRTGGTTSEFSETLDEQETFSNEIKAKPTTTVPSSSESSSSSSFSSIHQASSSSSAPADLSQSLGGGEKKSYEEVGGTITKVVFGDQRRFVLRVWFEEFRYTSLIVSDRTTAKQTCAIGAKKLHLDQFFFGLFAFRNRSELHCLADDDKPAELIERWLEEANSSGQPKPEIKFWFIRPQTSENLKMRKTTLTRWINFVLSPKSISISNLSRDLSDGVALFHLAHILLKKRITGAFNEHPSSKAEKKQNLTNAFETFRDFGISFTTDPVDEVLQGNLPGIMRALWSILFRYCTLQNTLCDPNDQMQTAQKQDASEFVFLEQLHSWCVKKTTIYTNFQITDFSKSWMDGFGFAGLFEQYDNYAVNYRKVLEIEDVKTRLDFVFDKAFNHFNIPSLIGPADLQVAEEIDEMSVIIYLSVLVMTLNEKKLKKARRASVLVPLAPKTSSSSSSPLSSVKIAFKIYFEGIPGIENKTFLFEKKIMTHEIRTQVASKMKIDPNGFWIYCVQSDGTERIADNYESPFAVEGQTVTIKSVSGSAYYASTSSTPTTPTMSPRGSPASPKKSKEKTKEKETVPEDTKAKTKSKRRSLFGLKLSS